MFRTEPIGAPGVYFRSDPPKLELRPERMDVCGFAGIAPRGPCRVVDLPEGWRREDGPFVRQWREGVFASLRTVAVPVDSFEDYKRRFGAFEGPGRLPYAVAAFFDQGGRRAWVSRVVHEYANSSDNFDGMAEGVVEGALPVNGKPFDFFARSEGTWGNRLRVAVGFSLRPLQVKAAESGGVTLDVSEAVPVGTLLRMRFPGGVFILSFVARVTIDRTAGRRDRRLEFDIPLAAVPEVLEIVEGELVIDDGAGNRETFTRLGLSSRHPRWLSGIVCYESVLVYPGVDWSDSDLVPKQPEHLPLEADLPALSACPQQWLDQSWLIADQDVSQFSGGRDRYDELVHEDFFDPGWVIGDLDPGSGIHSFAYHDEIASLVVPDLYCPEPLIEIDAVDEPVSLAGSEFSECVDLDPSPRTEPDPVQANQLCLDPSMPADLEIIIGLQQRLVQFAEDTRDMVVLLDVPPGLTQRQILTWRSRFRSSYAACYSPWLNAARDDDRRDRLILTNPSAVAAGIIAGREITFGVPFGPANSVAEAVVNVDESIAETRHDQLHPMGINVFLKEREGVRLAAARTLSKDAQLCQLSVRRLMILLVRVLQRQIHWMVFEPNNRRLWRDVRRMLLNFLANLYRSGAFRGSTEAEAFFVRCDEHTNPQPIVDAGKLVAEIGVAPAEPLEFIVLKITRDGDSALVSEV